jgi:putative Mn2+ efflux pump MntP
LDFISIILIAFGLALDAFAVSVGAGIALGKVTFKQAFRMSFHFGLFQFLMPVIGWLAGRSVRDLIAGPDHWVAFGLLAFVGGKMIWEGLHRCEGEKRGDPTRGATLILLSFATSIDALAVGLSLAFISVAILYPAVVIGLVAAALTALGINLGKKIGERFSHGVEVLGGIVLIGIGAKILLEHLT